MKCVGRLELNVANGETAVATDLKIRCYDNSSHFHLVPCHHVLCDRCYCFTALRPAHHGYPLSSHKLYSVHDFLLLHFQSRTHTHSGMCIFYLYLRCKERMDESFVFWSVGREEIDNVKCIAFGNQMKRSWWTGFGVFSHCTSITEVSSPSLG